MEILTLNCMAKLLAGRRPSILACVGLTLGLALRATEARGQSAEDIERALQDPLATIAGLMTDNTININSGYPETTTGYNFQL